VVDEAAVLMGIEGYADARHDQPAGSGVSSGRAQRWRHPSCRLDIRGEAALRATARSRIIVAHLLGEVGKALDDAITIVTTDAPSARRDHGDNVRRVVESTIPTDQLHANLDRFLDTLGRLLEARRTRSGDFELDEVGFTAEIGADGSFKLLGSGVGVSASSGVTFTWRRRPADA
jgi:hypothetical protein